MSNKITYSDRLRKFEQIDTYNKREKILKEQAEMQTFKKQVDEFLDTLFQEEEANNEQTKDPQPTNV